LPLVLLPPLKRLQQPLKALSPASARSDQARSKALTLAASQPPSAYPCPARPSTLISPSTDCGSLIDHEEKPLACRVSHHSQPLGIDGSVRCRLARRTPGYDSVTLGRRFRGAKESLRLRGTPLVTRWGWTSASGARGPLTRYSRKPDPIHSHYSSSAVESVGFL